MIVRVERIGFENSGKGNVKVILWISDDAQRTHYHEFTPKLAMEAGLALHDAGRDGIKCSENGM